MDDPVDRVFSHALSLVNKVKTGEVKPPPETRLQLYGLYKQSMEGDVERIMDRPVGNTVQVRQAQEKWDAWKEQEGLSRTAAKSRYIDALIAALNLYVEDGSASRELVSELEFVWNQVRPNVQVNPQASAYSNSVMSQSHLSLDCGDDEANDSDREDEFVDAVDSNDERRFGGGFWSESDRLRELDRSALFRDHDNLPGSLPAGSTSEPRDLDEPIVPSKALTRVPKSGKVSRRASGSGESRWKSRVELALEQLTAEVAALREQLAIQRSSAGSDSHSLFRNSFLSRILPWSSFFGTGGRFTWLVRLARWSTNVVWTALKHAAINALIIGVVATYLRRRALTSSSSLMGGLLPFPFGGEGCYGPGGVAGVAHRFEDAVRVLVGDAVAATVQHVRGAARRPAHLTAAGYSRGGDGYGKAGSGGKSAIFPSAVSMAASVSSGSSMSGYSLSGTSCSGGSCSTISSSVSSLSSAASLSEL